MILFLRPCCVLVDGNKAPWRRSVSCWQLSKHQQNTFLNKLDRHSVCKRRTPAAYCNLEGEQCQGDLLFTDGDVAIPSLHLHVARQALNVEVCVMEGENSVRLALLCLNISPSLCLCFQSVELYLAVAFVREEPATTGIWAHRAALIRWGLVPCATTACVRGSVCVYVCCSFVRIWTCEEAFCGFNFLHIFWIYCTWVLKGSVKCIFLHSV